MADQHGNAIAPRRAGVLDPAPPPEADRGVPVAGRGRRCCASSWARPPSTLARAIGYDNVGTVEFLLDADHRRVLLPGDEHPDPGRAPGHRGGRRAATWCWWQIQCARGEPLSGAGRRRPDRRPRRRGPPLRRGPGPGLAARRPAPSTASQRRVPRRLRRRRHRGDRYAGRSTDRLGRHRPLRSPAGQGRRPRLHPRHRHRPPGAVPDRSSSCTASPPTATTCWPCCSTPTSSRATPPPCSWPTTRPCSRPARTPRRWPCHVAVAALAGARRRRRRTGPGRSPPTAGATWAAGHASPPASSTAARHRRGRPTGSDGRPLRGRGRTGSPWPGGSCATSDPSPPSCWSRSTASARRYCGPTAWARPWYVNSSLGQTDLVALPRFAEPSAAGRRPAVPTAPVPGRVVAVEVAAGDPVRGRPDPGRARSHEGRAPRPCARRRAPSSRSWWPWTTPSTPTSS